MYNMYKRVELEGYCAQTYVIHACSVQTCNSEEIHKQYPTIMCAWRSHKDKKTMVQV